MSIPVFYTVFPSPFGQLGILWHETADRPTIQRVLLSNDLATAQERIDAAFGQARRGSHPAVLELLGQMRAFLDGQAIVFALDTVALDHCAEFQRRVLVAEHGIPRGSVSTYGLIAAHLGVQRASRAVGNALARNPFPLIIPCHRAVRSNGELGGYQGGLDMKRRLLEMEGVPISRAGKVLTPEFHYAR